MKRISKRFRNYLVVGVSVFLFELLVIWLCQRAGLSAVRAVAVAYVSGTLLSFFLQKLVTFRDKRMHHKVVGVQLLATTLLVLFNFGFTLLATAVLENLLPAVVIRTFALGATTIWNFYLYKTRIFSPDTPADAHEAKAPGITSAKRSSFLYLVGVVLVLSSTLAGAQLSNSQMWHKNLRQPTSVGMSARERGKIDKLAKESNIASRVDTSCVQNTVLQVIAHQDDDLLFMNPHTLTDLQQGTCVVTVYMTAGDIGRGEAYVEGRELGAQVAYGSMLGNQTMPWSHSTLTLNGRQLHIAQPEANKKVLLMFLRLHDGGVNGLGFSDRAKSLEHLLKHDGAMAVVGSEASYSRAQLVRTLMATIEATQPRRIRTHEVSPAHGSQGDHSDHTAVGRLTVRAAKQYRMYRPELGKPLEVQLYVGYPIRSKQPNLSASDQDMKRSLFLTYAIYDDVICPMSYCNGGTDSYEDYHSRLYSRQLPIR